MVRCVIRNRVKHFIDDLYHQVINLQLAYRLEFYQLQNIMMEKFSLCICPDNCGMKVVIGEKMCATVYFFQKPVKEIFFKIKDGALVGHCMCMRDGSFIFWLGDKNASIVRIQRMPEYIENKIPFADKADAKRRTVFRLRCSAIRTPAYKIPDGIKIRGIERMYIRIHGIKLKVKSQKSKVKKITDPLLTFHF